MVLKAVAFSAIVLAALAAQDTCSKDWTFFQGSCYRAIPVNLDFYQAMYNCNAQDGYLTEITSQKENEFVKGLVLQVVNTSITGSWLGAEYHSWNKMWEWWESDEVVSFSNWSMPSYKHASRSDCATLSTTGDMAWVPRYCNQDRGMMSVCEKCPVQKSCFQGSCYELLCRTTSGDEAEDQCLIAGGTMLKINSAAENNIVKDFLSGVTRNVWLGAKDEGSEGNFWWVSDRSSVDFDNWVPGQPDNAGRLSEDENCVAMDAGNNWRWKDEICGGRNVLVCESADTTSG